MPIEIPRPCAIHGERDWAECTQCWLLMKQGKDVDGEDVEDELD